MSRGTEISVLKFFHALSALFARISYARTPGYPTVGQLIFYTCEVFGAPFVTPFFAAGLLAGVAFGFDCGTVFPLGFGFVIVCKPQKTATAVVCNDLSELWRRRQGRGPEQDRERPELGESNLLRGTTAMELYTVLQAFRAYAFLRMRNIKQGGKEI